MSTTTPTTKESKKRRLVGVVVRKSGAKTVAVEIATKVAHPVYGKQISRTNRYLAHDYTDAIAVGDKVLIEESRPLSATKRWVVIEKTV